MRVAVPKICVSTPLPPTFTLLTLPTLQPFILALLLLLPPPNAVNGLLTLPRLLVTAPKLFTPVDGNVAFPKMLFVLALAGAILEKGEEEEEVEVVID